MIKNSCFQSRWISLVITFILIGSIVGLSSTSNRESRKLFGGYRITPKFCKASKNLPSNDPRSHGPTICMFNHECTQRQGEVVGACMDGFLFGACCQLPGTIESPIVETSINLDSSSSKPAAANSYEAYGSQSYLDDYSNEVDKSPVNDAIVISSPSSPDESSYFPSSTQSIAAVTHGEMYLPPSPHFSEELPVMISTTYGSIVDESTEADNDFTAAGISQISNTLLNEQSPNFNRSDITHPDADSVLIEDQEQEINNFGQQSFSQTPIVSSTTQTVKVTYAKPQFKPKPTISSAQSSKETYVLVHTISKPLDGEATKAPDSSISENDINSIESILLQLNDTKSGQQINNNDYPSSMLYSDSTPSYSSSSTDSIDFNKYGQTSFYITSNQPSSTTKQPSTSYVSTSSPTTRRPGTTQADVYDSVESDDVNIENNSNYGSFGPSSTFKPPSTSYIGSSTPVTRRPTTDLNEVHITPSTKKPIKKTTKKPITKRPTSKLPSTSYVYSPSPTKRPSSIGSSPVYASTTPTIILLAPIANEVPQEQVITSHNVEQTPIRSTSRPSPTVHITPKPTVNLVTSSSWTQKPSLIKITSPNPSTSYVYTSSSSVTQTPEFYHENNSDQSSPIPPYGGPISSDFYDPGYFGPTKKPTIIEHTVTSTNFYQVNEENDQPSTVYGQTPSYPTFNGNIEISTLHNEFHTSPNDLNNFPPVRNPNLNTSATATYNNGVSYGDDLQISTPSFVEDDVLNDKMSLLVNKIVASLQNNFENLETMVQNKNGSVVVVTQSTTQQDEKVTKRPTTTTVDQQQTVRPTKRPVVVKKPLTTVKPADVVVTTKAPLRTTTKRPVKRPVTTTTTVTRPGVTQSQPKPAVAKPVTTKKPLTRITTKRPVATKRPPARKPTTIPPTVTTKRPVRRTTVKPTRRITTTTESTLSDEYETEDEDEEIEEEGEDESSTISLSDNIQCGIRPHVKTGRIVGGKAASFAAFPWQVLVRESTWLGLFTKNKCGGVLLNNNFVVTAAHCQPGFLASLVAVFGEYDISGELESKRSVTKNVKRVIEHRQYNPATFENDLALLELESPIHYDTHIVPICMPADDADFTGRMATVTGWGRLKYGGGVPSVLQEVQVPIMENDVCQEMFNTKEHKKQILPSFLCAGYANGQKDSCEGDSGGPLVLQRPDGRWELAGTVSHGIRCASPYLPGVYMRTTYYKPWFESITGVH